MDSFFIKTYVIRIIRTLYVLYVRYTYVIRTSVHLLELYRFRMRRGHSLLDYMWHCVVLCTVMWVLYSDLKFYRKHKENKRKFRVFMMFFPLFFADLLQRTYNAWQAGKSVLQRYGCVRRISSTSFDISLSLTPMKSCVDRLSLRRWIFLRKNDRVWSSVEGDAD